MVDRHRIVLEDLAQKLAALAIDVARVEHIELGRGDVGELSLGLMARGGKVVFGSLLGW